MPGQVGVGPLACNERGIDTALQQRVQRFVMSTGIHQRAKELLQWRPHLACKFDAGHQAA
ncbi:hypothetical protein D3C72_2239450 [compost metagenome]